MDAIAKPHSQECVSAAPPLPLSEPLAFYCEQQRPRSSARSQRLSLRARPHHRRHRRLVPPFLPRPRQRPPRRHRSFNRQLLHRCCRRHHQRIALRFHHRPRRCPSK